MGKTLILSQEQFNRLLEEEPINYLDSESDMPDNIAFNQTFVGDPKEKSDEYLRFPDSETNDGWNKLCALKTTASVSRMFESYTKKEFEKKAIDEINQALKNQAIEVVNPANGNKTISSEGALAVQKTKAKKKMANGVPGAKEKYNAISRALDNRRKPVERMKAIKKANGDENAYQKAGGTRNNGGKAHTPKTAEGNITYFE